MEQILAIAAFGLQRMAEGMAEIEQRAALLLGSSGCHDLGLGAQETATAVAPGGEIAVQQGGAMALSHSKKADRR